MSTSERGRSRSLALALALVFAAPPFACWTVPVSAAEPTSAELALARELFAQGVKLEEAHDWTGALAKFRQIAAVKQTPAVHFHLGLCLQNTGKLGSAYVEFQRAEVGADLDQTPAAALIGTKAKEHLADLVGKVPMVALHLPGDLVGASGVKVVLDGEAVSIEKISAIPLDIGNHAVHVEAQGRVPFDAAITIVGSESKSVDVVLPLAKTTPPPPPTTVLVDRDRDSNNTSAPRVWPWVVGAVGVAALAGAGTMYAYRASALAELEGACGNGHADCPPSKRAVADHGHTYATVGNVLLVVSGVALTTATVWLLLPSSSNATSPPKSSSGSMQLYVGGASLLGGGVIGSF